MHALVTPNGRVAQLAEATFPVAAPLQWIEAPEGVTTRHRYEDGEFVPPPEPEPIDLPAYAARKRWECEVGGATWNGWPVHTDRESQSKITSERLAIEAEARTDPDGWKFADGEFRQVSNTDFVALSDAVRAHVRQCFATEAQVLADIASGEITTAAEIDAAFARE